MNRATSLFAMGALVWASAIGGTMMAGQFQLACEIFLYGFLLGWGILMLFGRRLSHQPIPHFAHRVQHARLIAPSRTDVDFRHALGIVVTCSCVLGGSLAALALGFPVIAMVILVAALCGGMAGHWMGKLQ